MLESLRKELQNIPTLTGMLIKALTKTFGTRRSYDYYEVEWALSAVEPYYGKKYTHKIVRNAFRYFCHDEILPKDNYWHEPLYEAVARFMREYQKVEEEEEEEVEKGYYSDPENDFIIIYNKEY